MSAKKSCFQSAKSVKSAKLTGDRRWDTGEGRQEMGDKRRETRNERQEMGDVRWETGRRRET